MKSHTVFKDTLHNGVEIEKYLNKNIFIYVFECTASIIISNWKKYKIISKGTFLPIFLFMSIHEFLAPFFWTLEYSLRWESEKDRKEEWLILEIYY